jgi:hypothetical protein
MENIQSVERQENSDILKMTKTDGTIHFVPQKNDNTDYQKILEWVAEGNTITDNGGSN